MRFHLDVYLKFYEYQFYALCSLILVMNVNAEVHILRFLHLMHHAMQILIL